MLAYDRAMDLIDVNEIETLCTGLSGKGWQKITLLERATARADGAESAAPSR